MSASDDLNEDEKPVYLTYQEYTKTIQGIENNLTVWNNDTRRQLKTWLGNLVRITLWDWEVVTDSQLTNMQSVSLVMPDQASSIAIKDGGPNFDRKGGRLIFAQRTDGLISIAVKYPKIDNVGLIVQAKILDTVTPEELTQKHVNYFVAQFLEEMTGWLKKGATNLI